MKKNIYTAPVSKIIEVQLGTIIAQSRDFENLSSSQSSDDWEDE